MRKIRLEETAHILRERRRLELTIEEEVANLPREISASQEVKHLPSELRESGISDAN